MDALARAIARPEPVAGLADRSPLAGLARRSVGFADVLAQSVSAVAPAGAAFTTPLLVSALAGGVSLPALAATLVIALLTASTINEFTRRMAASGSLYTFVARGLGSAAAFVAGVGLLIGYGFIAMFALAGAGYHLVLLVARLLPVAIDPMLLAAGSIVALGALCLVVLARGIRLSTRVTLLVEATSVTLIVALIVAVIASNADRLPVLLRQDAPFDPQGFAVAATLAITAFVGFESSAALGVEAKRPFANIPRAISWTVLVSGVVYLGAAAAQTVGFDVAGLDPASSTSPANDLAAAFGVPWAGLVLDVSIATSLFACAVASSTALVRVLFSMGREGLLPPALGTTHPRYRTPLVATLVALPVVIVVPLAVVFLTGSVWTAMTVLIIFAAAGYILAYVLACVAAPVFLHRIGELGWWPAIKAAVAAVALSGVVLLYLAEESHGARAFGVWGFLALLAAGIAVYWARLLRRPWLRHAIGVYDHAVAGDVLGGIPEAEWVDDAEPADRRGR
ncbi:APC family permease [Agromyces bauzanensis]